MNGDTDLVGSEVVLWYTGQRNGAFVEERIAAGCVRMVTFDRDGEPSLWLHVHERHIKLLGPANLPRVGHIYRWPVMGPFRIEVIAHDLIGHEVKAP